MLPAMSRSAGCVLTGAALIVAWVPLGGAAQARDCTMLLPRGDGVLRLDNGEAVAVPCGGPRSAYAALPPRAVAPPRPSVPPRAAAPAAAAPDQQGSVAPDAAGAGSLRQLQDEAARLKSEVSRLTDETLRLRGETARLGDELARREGGMVTVAPPQAMPPTAAAPAGEDRSAAAEREFERQKGVVERAWSELVDMATRMKRELRRP